MSSDELRYEEWQKQSSFTDVTEEMKDRLSRAKRRENAKRKDRRSKARFSRSNSPIAHKRPAPGAFDFTKED